MPKIEVNESNLYNYLGERLTTDELERLFPYAKAELDFRDEQSGTLKIELNDTNRPDLWSTAGLARQLRIVRSGNIPSYSFFATPDSAPECEGREIIVDEELAHIRPYITGFAITGESVDEELLIDLIQTQEKLCWNFGQKRRAIAMGVYRSDLITYPIRYIAADPDSNSFVPLEFDRELTLRQILEEHPKGEDYGGIVEQYEKYPFITDDRGDVLSFPPIINSDRIGAVEEGDRELFIELTGTDINTLTLATSIVACDLADSGHTILPVKTIYPYDTPFGREVVNPFYFQEPVSVDIGYVGKLLGEKLGGEEAAAHVRTMGLDTRVEGNTITVHPPPYRDDFLHAVDIVEDIMIGRGMESFEPIMPTDFTVGRYTDMTEFSRRVKDILVGLGFQEMVYTYLGSRQDYIGKMVPQGEEHPHGDTVIRIANPMSENYEFVRQSIIPSLLASESVSGNAVYPHKIFEIGKVAWLDESQNSGTRTSDYLGFLTADRDVDFTSISSHVSALFFYLNKEYRLEESSDPRFIKGRSASIMYNDTKVGIFGEVHPGVLEQWGIQMPSTACEIDLNLIM